MVSNLLKRIASLSSVQLIGHSISMMRSFVDYLVDCLLTSRASKSVQVRSVLGFCLPHVQLEYVPEILKILLRDEKLADDVDVQDVAKKTESFSGSDLKREWKSV